MRSAAAWICSIAFCLRATAAMGSPSPASARSISKTHVTPTIRVRSIRKAAVPRRAIFRALICTTCSRPTRTLGGTLLSIVNLFYYQDLTAGAREAIARRRFADYRAEIEEQWAAKQDLG